MIITLRVNDNRLAPNDNPPCGGMIIGCAEWLWRISCLQMY